jgi:hypothetical protein
MSEKKKKGEESSTSNNGMNYYSNSTQLPKFEGESKSIESDQFEYVSDRTSFYDFDRSYDFIRGELTSYFDEINSYDVRTSTMVNKFEEIQNHYFKPIKNLDLNLLKEGLWNFDNLHDKELTIQQIQSIEPVLIRGDKNWIHYRRMIHSAEYSSGVGRSLKYYIIDRNSKKLLGLIELSSDFGSLGSRDIHLGWTHENRFNDGKLNNTAILSTCVSVQPFGHNVLGGKLMALLACSDVVRNDWKTKYGDELLGITTTSLFGNRNLTMYDGMDKIWTKLNETKGDVIPNLPGELFRHIKNILKKCFPKELKQAESKTTPKQKVLNLILDKYSIPRKDCTHGYERGVYFSEFYKETKQILCGSDIPPILTPIYKSTVNDLFQYWLTQSITRYEKLHKKGGLKNDILFYDNLI